MDAVSERVREIDDRRHLLQIEKQIECYLDSKRGDRGKRVISNVRERIGALIATRKQIQKRRRKRKLWWGQPFRGQFAKRLPAVQ